MTVIGTMKQTKHRTHAQIRAHAIANALRTLSAAAANLTTSLYHLEVASKDESDSFIKEQLEYISSTVKRAVEVNKAALEDSGTFHRRIKRQQLEQNYLKQKAELTSPPLDKP